MSSKDKKSSSNLGKSPSNFDNVASALGKSPSNFDNVTSALGKSSSALGKSTPLGKSDSNFGGGVDGNSALNVYKEPTGNGATGLGVMMERVPATAVRSCETVPTSRYQYR